MSYNLRNRSFVKELDFEPAELRHLLKVSEALKTAKYAGTEVKRLDGKEIALIFEKTSTRTRSAFEVAAFDQGAHVTYLDPSGSQMGHKESVADTARVLGRMYDAIEYRGNRQADVEALAEHAGRPRLQRPDRRVAPDADARRLPHHARGVEPALRRAQLRVRRRLPVQHGPLAARDGRAHGRRRPPRRPARAGAARRRRRRRERGGRRAPAPGSRSPTTSPRRRGRRLRPHGRVGVDGRGRRTSGTSGSTCSAPTRSTPTSWPPPATGRPSSCTACPPSTTRTRWSARR